MKPGPDTSRLKVVGERVANAWDAVEMAEDNGSEEEIAEAWEIFNKESAVSAEITGSRRDVIHAQIGERKYPDNRALSEANIRVAKAWEDVEMAEETGDQDLVKETWETFRKEAKNAYKIFEDEHQKNKNR